MNLPNVSCVGTDATAVKRGKKERLLTLTMGTFVSTTSLSVREIQSIYANALIIIGPYLDEGQIGEGEIILTL